MIDKNILTILEANPLPYLIIQAKGFCIISANQAFLKSINSSTDLLIGTDINRSFDFTSNLTSLIESLIKVKSTGQSDKIHIQCQFEPAEVWQLNNMPIINEKKQTEYIILLIEQINKQEETVPFSNVIPNKEIDQKYDQLFSLIRQPMWVYDTNNYRFLDVNDAAINYYGYSRAEFLSMTIKDITPTEDLNLLEDAVGFVRTNQELFTQGFYRHKKKNGSIIHVDLSCNLIHAFGKQCELVLMNDITAQIAANNSIRLYNERLHVAQQIAKLGYWELNMKTNQVFWGEEMYAIWERDTTLPALTPNDFLDTLHIEDRPSFIAYQKTVLKGDYLPSFEFRIITPTGKIKYIAQQIDLILDEHGQRKMLRGTVQDISIQKANESALEAKSRLLEVISEFNKTLLKHVDQTEVLEYAFGVLGSVLSVNSIYYLGYSWAERVENSSVTLNVKWSKQQDTYMPLLKKSLEYLVSVFLTDHLPNLVSDQFVLISANILPEGQFKEQLIEYGIFSLQALPIFVSTVFHGLIIFEDNSSDIFRSEDEQFFLQSIINSLTIALEKCVANEAALENKQHLKSVINNIPGITYRCLADNNWTMLFISDEVERLTGYPPEQFIHNQQRSFASIIHADDVNNNNKIYGCLDRLSIFKVRYRIVTRDGDIIWVEDRGMGTYDKNGKLLWIDGVILDISEKKASDDKFKAIFEQTKDSIILFDDDCLLVDFNQATVQLLGYTARELNGLNIEQIFKNIQTTDNANCSEQIINHILNIKLSELITKDGSIRLINCAIQANILSGIHLAVITDVTERKRQEEQLVYSEKRFKALVQEGYDLIAIMDTTGNYTFVSESCRSILHAEPEYYVGKNAFEFIHPDDKKSVIIQFEQLLQNKQIQIEPFRFKNGNGEWRWISTLLTNLLDEPAVCGIVVNTMDVTESVIKNNELKLSNDKYQLILKATNEAICDWDIKNDYTIWGQGFHDIFGYDLSVYNNTLLSDNIHPDDRTWVMNMLKETMEDKNADHFFVEYKFLKADRSISIVQQRALFLRDETGEAIRLLSSFRDITQIEESLYKIKIQNEQLKEIAWIQSHVVRAPLARIMGLIDLLNTQEKHSNEKNDALILEYLSSSAKELDTIIKDIITKSDNINK